MANENDQRTNPSPSSIPPPLDPFPTYQTPYPRSNTDNDNPFIQFRRFADEQFSSMFNGIPQLFGFASGSSFKNELEDMMKRHQGAEERWRKQFEQEVEEMRQAFEREMQANQGQTESQKPWWNRGNAAKCPALNGELQQSCTAKGALSRGSSNSPNTELELYENIKDQHDKGCYRFPAQSNPKCHSRQWFSSLGWDGKQMKDCSRYDQMGDDMELANRQATSSPSKYTAFRARQLNPIENTQHTIPWLVLSAYSPVYLCKPDQPRLFKVHIQDNDDIPFQISKPRFRRHWISTEIDEKMAQHLPWADAFEDLVSLQQTGKMVERDYSTWSPPTTWIHDMVSRGSLGPRWGFNDEGQLLRSRPDETPEPPASSQDLTNPVRIQSTSDDAATANSLPDDDWPSPEEVVNAMSRMLEDVPSEEMPPSGDDQASPRSSHADDEEDTQPTKPWWLNTSSIGTHDNNTEAVGSIVSTMTTTKRRTLPDGSIETTRVLKKRFADGTEESDESVEVESQIGQKPITSALRSITHHETQDKQTQTPIQDEILKQKHKGGWFWN